MAEERKQWQPGEMERAAEERRRDIEDDDTLKIPDAGRGLFNPVEGVAPHGAGIPDRED